MNPSRSLFNSIYCLEAESLLAQAERLLKDAKRYNPQLTLGPEFEIIELNKKLMMAEAQIALLESQVKQLKESFGICQECGSSNYAEDLHNGRCINCRRDRFEANGDAYYEDREENPNPEFRG